MGAEQPREKVHFEARHSLLPSVNFLLYFVLAGATGRTPDPFSEPRAPTSFSARGGRLSEEQRVLTPPPPPPTLRAWASSVVDRNPPSWSFRPAASRTRK